MKSKITITIQAPKPLLDSLERDITKSSPYYFNPVSQKPLLQQKWR